MQQTAHVPGSSPPSGASGSDSTTDQAKQQAQEVAGKAQEKAQETAQQAKSRLRDQVDTRSTEAGQKVSTTADDLRSVGEQLRQQGKDGPAKLADQAAERVQRVGGYLQDSDADRILQDVEDAARQRPWAVVLGGLALGVAASRLLKASSVERYQTRSYGGGYGTAGTTGTTGIGTGTGSEARTERFTRPAASPTPAPATPVTPAPYTGGGTPPTPGNAGGL